MDFWIWLCAFLFVIMHIVHKEKEASCQSTFSKFKFYGRLKCLFCIDTVFCLGKFCCGVTATWSRGIFCFFLPYSVFVGHKSCESTTIEEPTMWQWQIICSGFVTRKTQTKERTCMSADGHLTSHVNWLYSTVFQRLIFSLPVPNSLLSWTNTLPFLKLNSLNVNVVYMHCRTKLFFVMLSLISKPSTVISNLFVLERCSGTI